jgi:hypothetical protein
MKELLIESKTPIIMYNRKGFAETVLRWFITRPKTKAINVTKTKYKESTLDRILSLPRS